jgi:hypothetical protein
VKSSRFEAADQAYSPLEAPDILPLLSLVAFSASIGARPLARLLPRALRVYPWGVLAPALMAVGFALVGFLLALVAARRRSRRGLARIALLLNGIVLGLTGLALLAAIWILKR